MPDIEIVEEEFEFPKVHKAKYKLEIYFAEDRSMHHDYRGVVKCWERGSGADTSIYFCPHCFDIIMKEALGPMSTYKGKPCKEYFGGVCAKCGRQFDGEELVDMVSYRCSTERWAEILEFFFHRLNGDTDLYLKHGLERLDRPYGEYMDRPNYRNAINVAHTLVAKTRLLLTGEKIIRDSLVTPVRGIIKAFISA